MFEAILKEVSTTVKESVQIGLKALSDKFELRFKSLEKHLESLPTPEKGEKGDKGDKGDAPSIEEIAPVLRKMVEAIPVPEKGEKGDPGEKGDKGDSVTLDEVRPVVKELVSEAVQHIEVPEVDYEKVQEFVKAEIAILPAGKDGASVTPEEVRPIITEEVEKVVQQIEPAQVDYEAVKGFIHDAVQAIPVPKDGTSVTLEDVHPLIEEAVTKAVQNAIPEIDYELIKAFVQEEIKQIPLPKDGKSITPEEMRPMLQEMVDALDIPPGEKGEPGQSVTLEDVTPLIEDRVSKQVKEAVAQIPPAKDGAPGKDAEPVDMKAVEAMTVHAVAEAIAKAKNTLLTELKSWVDTAVKTKMSEMPVPKDGKDADPVDMSVVQKMIETAVEGAAAKIQVPEPRHGEDGRDALQLEILPAIDAEKTFPRNTYALHKGGLWRSYERTQGMRGWETVVDGVADIQIDYDGERGVKIVTEKSSGELISKDFTIPVMIYREVYKEGRMYQKGDTVTWAGSTWTCLNETTDKPGSSSSAWRLSVKSGRDANTKVKVGA